MLKDGEESFAVGANQPSVVTFFSLTVRAFAPMLASCNHY